MGRKRDTRRCHRAALALLLTATLAVLGTVVLRPDSVRSVPPRLASEQLSQPFCGGAITAGPRRSPSPAPEPPGAAGSTATAATARSGDDGDETCPEAAPSHASAGAITRAWTASGAETGPLGFPTTGEYAVAGGAAQHFQYGSIYWSPATAARLLLDGRLATRYTLAGGPGGPWGFPRSEVVAVGPGWAQDFATGTAVWGSAAAVVLLDTASYLVWTANQGTYGWPQLDSWAVGDTVHTRFLRLETIWDRRTAALYSATAVDATTVLLLGDSQLSGDSWSEQGTRGAGFGTAMELGFGGWGYTRAVDAPGGTPDAVITSGRLLLPHGSPGAIVLMLGGNDASSGASNTDILHHATATWAALRHRYPQAPLIINGVMSSTTPEHTRRRAVDALLIRAARDAGFTAISVAGLATTAGATYADAVHLTPAGHTSAAATYTPLLREALGR